jgi:hypothetical protein
MHAVKAEPTEALQKALLEQRQDQIEARRSEADRVLAAQERICEQRFAVTDCLNEARRTHRQTQVVLRQQDQSVQSELRAAKDKERQSRLQEKQAQHPAPPPDQEINTSRPVDRSSAALSATSAPERGNDGVRGKVPLDLPGATRDKKPAAQSDGGAHVQAYMQKQEQLRQRRLERDRKLAEKPGTKPALPLPN